LRLVGIAVAAKLVAVKDLLHVYLGGDRTGQILVGFGEDNFGQLLLNLGLPSLPQKSSKQPGRSGPRSRTFSMDDTRRGIEVDAEVLARPTEKEPHFSLAAPAVVKDRNHHPGILTKVFIPFQVAGPLLESPGICLRSLARADLRGAVAGQTELATDGRVGA